jgi:hypothetical protein
MKRIVMGFRGVRFVVHVLLRVVFGGKMEKLVGGGREWVMELGE